MGEFDRDILKETVADTDDIFSLVRPVVTGFGCPPGFEEGSCRRRLRFSWIGSALLPTRQHHLAAGGRWVKYRGVENRRPQHRADDRGIHEDPAQPAGRTHSPDSGAIGERGRETDGGCAVKTLRRHDPRVPEPICGRSGRFLT